MQLQNYLYIFLQINKTKNISFVEFSSENQGTTSRPRRVEKQIVVRSVTDAR